MTATTTAGTLWARLPGRPVALAFNFGTPIPVTFSPTVFQTVQPGATLTGSVILTCASGACGNTAPITVVFAVTVVQPATNAILTGMSPTNLPVAVAGQTFTVTLYGAGFVFGSTVTPNQNTIVGVSTVGVIATNSNIAVNVVNASTIILTLTVPSTRDAALPFGTPTNVAIGVCNPNGAPNCTAATSTMTLALGAGPMIQSGGVTSASTFQTITAGTGTVAPYGILSIFESNFCVSNGTGCAESPLLYPTVTNNQYPNVLSPDGVRNLQVFFYTPTGQTTTGGVAAPLLFATNNQLNLIVPGALVAGTSYDIVVKFGPSGSQVASPAYTVKIAATNPGIFVIDASNNSGAIEVAATGMVVGSTTGKVARIRALQADSDNIAVYMTGLGVPTSTALNTAGTGIIFTDCLSVGAFEAAAGTPTTALTSLDGVILNAGLPVLRFVPCFDPTLVTAKVGGVNVGSTGGQAGYAGWVSGSVAGLYQVNVGLPAYQTANFSIMNGGTAQNLTTFGTPIELPIVVTTGYNNSGLGLTVSPNNSVPYDVGVFVEAAATITITSATGYTTHHVADYGSAAVTIDTLKQGASAPLMTTPGFLLTAVSGSDSTGYAPQPTTDFTVGAVNGHLTIVSGSAVKDGTFYLTVTMTDTGGGLLPVETKIFTVTILP